jgi:5-formyltetrahydrofolate cyclo-ligase
MKCIIGVSMTKAETRSYMKNIRNSLSEEEQDAFSNSILKRLRNLEVYKSCRYLFSFVSMQSEVNTRKIIRQALRDEKLVFSPRVEGKTMDFYKIDSLETLITSKFGVLEPVRQENRRYAFTRDMKLSIASIGSGGRAGHNLGSGDLQTKLMLLPGLAFDLSGNRIGYGAGYYDRYLSDHGEEDFIKIALAYDFQVSDRIASEAFDVRADMILTPTRLIRCR